MGDDTLTCRRRPLFNALIRHAAPALSLCRPRSSHALALAVFRVKHGQMGSFFEIGPLVPLFARLGMWLGGADEFGLRFFAPLLALAASLVVWRLA